MIDWCRNVIKHTYQRIGIKPLISIRWINYCIHIYMHAILPRKTFYIVSPYHEHKIHITVCEHFFSGSVPFRKIPISVWVSVLCGTKRNHLKKLKIFFYHRCKKFHASASIQTIFSFDITLINSLFINIFKAPNTV